MPVTLFDEAAPVTILSFDDDDFPSESDAADRAEDDAAACVSVARKLIAEAGKKLALIANNRAGPYHTQTYTVDAADCLYAAGILLGGERKFDLLRLSATLRVAIQKSHGDPSTKTLDEVADALDRIEDALAAEAGGDE